jgi:omega-6 fatty acid desaturase (delta-12 desaturase)
VETSLNNEQEGIGATTAPREARDWMKIIARYRDPNPTRSLFEVGITFVPFVLLWLVIWLSIHFDQWIGLILVVPAAAFLVRLFMIQHDCSHGSFFRNRGFNDWLGRAISVLTLTPYDHWRHTHAVHHATSGNLAQRGVGDIDTLTVREYLALSPWRRFCYRLYRHPVVMFGIGPLYLFIVQHRFPVGMMRRGWQPWLSTMATNFAIAVVVATVIWFVGLKAFLLIQVPIIALAASAGVWLFYVQHQFEETFWADGGTWNVHEAALRGSSHYDLPFILRWFTANIGVHHVHHLCSRIPFYRLRQVLRSHPELTSMGRLTLLQSFDCVRLVLWDEARKKLVSFGELRGAR